MVALDAQKRIVRVALDIDRNSVGCVFDTVEAPAYSSKGDIGTVTAVGEGAPGKFKVVSTVPTQAIARTITFDPKTHRLYRAVPSVPPSVPGDQPKIKGRRNHLPGSLVLVFVGD
jgi:hypothetical protein